MGSVGLPVGGTPSRPVDLGFAAAQSPLMWPIYGSFSVLLIRKTVGASYAMPSIDFAPLMKAAVRELVQQCAVQGETGPNRAAALLGVSGATVSRWCSDAYPEQMPPDKIMLLSFKTSSTTVASVLASAAHHTVVPSDADAGSTASVMSGFYNLLRETAELQSTWAEAASDGRFTPAERRDLRAKMLHTVDVLTGVVSAIGGADGAE